MPELSPPETVPEQSDDEAVPAEGCDVCRALVEQRRAAAVNGDPIGVEVANREIAKHPHGFTTFADDEPGYVPATVGDDVMTLHKVRNGKPLCPVEIPPYERGDAAFPVVEWKYRHVTCPECLALPD